MLTNPASGPSGPAAVPRFDSQIGARAVDVSVLVPVRNEAASIAATIETIRAQELDESVEFLLLEGRSTDDSREILERAMLEDPRIRVIDNPGRTIPRALNLGLRHAKGEFIVRMDGHTRYPANYIAAGLDRLRKGEVACVTGPAVALGVDVWSRRVALALSSWLGTGGAVFRRPGDGGIEVEVDRGFGGVWRRTTLEAHGGWDEGSPVNEDGELAARILKQGGRIVCLPEMAAHYLPRSSLLALARQYVRYGYYRARTASRHSGSMAPAHALPPGLVLALLANALPRLGVRRPARVAVLAYITAALFASAQTRDSAPARDVAALPLVFVTMHLAWGIGFLSGCVRFRPRPRAFDRARRRGPAA